MKNDPTIHIFNCEKCGKKTRIQSVYDLLRDICGDCWLKEHFEKEDKNVRR